jgi:DNA repair photolyase
MLHMPREQFFCEHPKPRPRILESLERAADKMAARGDRRRGLFSFIGDVYCHLLPEDDVTREALQIMVDRGLNFEVCTKGGLRAERDFDLLQQGGRLGLSMVWRDGDSQRELEPRAADLNQRRCLVGIAKEHGLYVWMSIEPVIVSDEALWAIRNANDEGADEFRLGKINPRTIHQLPIEWQARVRAIDWPAFVAEAHDLLVATGKRFIFKESLHEYLDGRPATGGPEVTR